MESRPRIHLTLSPLDKIIESTGVAFFVLLWLITIYSFARMPDQVPSHFNFSGKVDSYSGKWNLIVLPIIASVIYIAISQLGKYPHIFNYPVQITEQNAPRQYAIATRMLRLLKVMILVIFSLIIWFVYLTSTGAKDGLGLWFLPLMLALVFTPIVISIRSAFKNK